jgi:hypothetical protein
MEFKRRPGQVRDRIQALQNQWRSYLAHAIETAQELGELRAEIDPRQLAFELNAYSGGADADFNFHGELDAFAKAREAMRERLESVRAS